MKYLRCGYCCYKYAVIIVDDPKKGVNEDNLIPHLGDGPCKHLQGDGPGDYDCALHDYPWYKETPCYAHTQIGKGPCRMGKHILGGNNEKSR